MKTKKYTMYSDAGHSWLKVSKKELKGLGIADKISHYSYQRGDYAYLEEDCDYSIFVEVMNSIGCTVQVVEKYSKNRSKIRSYDCYLQPATTVMTPVYNQENSFL
jgi:hypothetical protein